MTAKSGLTRQNSVQHKGGNGKLTLQFSEAEVRLPSTILSAEKQENDKRQSRINAGPTGKQKRKMERNTQRVFFFTRNRNLGNKEHTITNLTRRALPSLEETHAPPLRCVLHTRLHTTHASACFADTELNTVYDFVDAWDSPWSLKILIRRPRHAGLVGPDKKTSPLHCTTAQKNPKPKKKLRCCIENQNRDAFKTHAKTQSPRQWQR